MELLNIDNARSYATEANLLEGIRRIFGEQAFRFMVVRNRAGRYTAVFAMNPAHVAYCIANAGFKVFA